MYSMQVVVGKKAYLAPYTFHLDDTETVITFYPDRMDEALLLRVLQLALPKVAVHWRLNEASTRWRVQHWGDMFQIKRQYRRTGGVEITLSPSGRDDALVSA